MYFAVEALELKYSLDISMEEQDKRYGLTMAQEFEMVKFKEAARRATREELEQMFLETARNYMRTVNAAREFVKERIGADL